MSNSGHTALDHVGAITLAESIRNMALGAGEFRLYTKDGGKPLQRADFPTGF